MDLEYTVAMKNKHVIIFLLMLLTVFSLSAENYYDTNSQVFTITAGADFPFTNSYFADDGKMITKLWMGDEGTHFSVGGYGSIDYEVFVNSKISLGGEIGYLFNRCSDEKLFTQVPLLFKATYVPLQGKFDLPISLGLGFNYLSYNSKSMFALASTLTIGPRFFFTDSWGIGIKSGINVTFELYTKTAKNGIHTSIPCVLYVSYRH